jgi:hypothetical protein
MSQQSSLTQSAHSVRQVLTDYTPSTSKFRAMIYGAILRSPVEGGAPDQINDAAARAVTGVTDGSTPHQAWRGAFG